MTLIVGKQSKHIFISIFGQIVSTSTDPSELCINGMSFSRRASKWANAALVVTVSKRDFDPFHFHGSLSGVAFQVLFSFLIISCVLKCDTA